MKRRMVVLLIGSLSIGTALAGCARARTIRQTEAALSYLDEAEEFATEHQAGMDAFFDGLKAELAESTESTVEPEEMQADPDIYEQFTREVVDFDKHPDKITLHVLEDEGSRFDTDSEGIDLREALLIFLMNDTDHDVLFEVDGVIGTMSLENIPIAAGQGCYFMPGDYMTEDGEVTIRRTDLDGNVEAERTLWIAL